MKFKPFKKNKALLPVIILCSTINIFSGAIGIVPQQNVINQHPQNNDEDASAVAALKKCPNTKYPTSRYFGTGFVGIIPQVKMTINENTWTQKMNQPCIFDEAVIRDQFQTDIALWLNTILVKKGVGEMVGGKKLKAKHISKLNETQNFLKRWFLLMAFSPLKYVTKDNAGAKNPGTPDYQIPQPFPYPLASALSHGQRMIIELQDVVNGKGLDSAFYNLLLGGDTDEKPIIDELRSFASHGTHQEPNGKVAEDKLLSGFMSAIQLDHHMVDVPLGGVGNKNEMGFFIGAEGQSYKVGQDTGFGNFQLGHIFIGVHRFNNGVSSLLMGVESTAPHKNSPFKTGGKNHNITSGMKDSTTNRSATGGQKWANLLGGMAPATYGGMIINVTRVELPKIKLLFDTVLAMPENQQALLFQKILTMNANEANQYLRSMPELASVFA
ncbi:MAG: hypothetical protein KBD31_00470 [Proteobacteria bacterium]|nr:hypothetical protein [Pseudomonadota bacterium]